MQVPGIVHTLGAPASLKCCLELPFNVVTGLNLGGNCDGPVVRAHHPSPVCLCFNPF